MAVKTKRCSVCGKTLPITQFSKDKNRPDGLAYRCRHCNAKIVSEYARTHSEQRKAYSRVYYNRYKDRILARQARYEQEQLNREISAVTGIKAVVLNHAKATEPKYQIVEYGEPTVYQGYATAAEFLKALEEKCK